MQQRHHGAVNIMQYKRRAGLWLFVHTGAVFFGICEQTNKKQGNIILFSESLFSAVDFCPHKGALEIMNSLQLGEIVPQSCQRPVIGGESTTSMIGGAEQAWPRQSAGIPARRGNAAI
jgi:hypothetical protein